MTIDLSNFRQRNIEIEGKRSLYFDHIDKVSEEALTGLGYNVIRLIDLKRENPTDASVFCSALLQGVSDGTIYLEKERLDALKLEMTSLGMLDKKTQNFNVSLKADASMADLWNWNASRHTLTNNATLQLPEKKEIKSVKKTKKGKVK